MNERDRLHHSEHETKFVLNRAATPAFLRWLECRCRTDPIHPAGTIWSIYYDTREWHFLGEKINSDFLKTKVRIRWYADIMTGEMVNESFLEAKLRTGSRRKKIRLQTNISGRRLTRINLNHPWLLSLPRLLRQKGVLLPDILLPVFRIKYNRRRFIEPTTGMKLSLDYDIRVAGVNWQMIPRTNPFQLRHAVVELKGKLSGLPDVLHQLTALGARKESFSKYLMCYQKIMRTHF